jgi:spoIIIJ-associated protein
VASARREGIRVIEESTSGETRVDAVAVPSSGSDAEQTPSGNDSTLTPEAGASTKESGKREFIRRLEVEGDIAADYLEELLDIADLDGDLDMDVEGERAAVSIVGSGLDALIGSQGEVLEALQELTRLAVFQATGERSRLMLDIGGHRASRRQALETLTMGVVERVRASGDPEALDPMTPFERKVVHDAVARAGLRSESEGEAPDRRVVILPA